MAAVTTSQLPSDPLPGDADLQELYDQVLAGFSEESPTVEATPRSSLEYDRDLDPSFADAAGKSPMATAFSNGKFYSFPQHFPSIRIRKY